MWPKQKGNSIMIFYTIEACLVVVCVILSIFVLLLLEVRTINYLFSIISTMISMCRRLPLADKLAMFLETYFYAMTL